MSRTAQVFAIASEIIDEKGWTQHAYTDPSTGGVCVAEALIRATDLVVGSSEQSLIPGRVVNWAFSRFEQTIQAASHDSWKGGSITVWNDDPQRTVEDVQLALKQAIEAES